MYGDAHNHDKRLKHGKLESWCLNIQEMMFPLGPKGRNFDT
jgi:hypothetical protein